METDSIKKIKGYHEKVFSALEDFKIYHKSKGTDMNAAQYGSENEYSVNGIVCGVRNIMSDISFLTRSHNLFLKISTYSERSNISSHLSSLYSSLSNKNSSSVVSYLDNLKTCLRYYNVRLDKDRLIDFNTEIDKLRRTANELEDEINTVKEKLADSSNLHESIVSCQEETTSTLDKIKEKKDAFIEEYNTFVEEVGDFRSLASKAKENEATISQQLDIIKEEKETFDDFIEKINERETMLEKQNQVTEDYKQKLNDYEKQHSEKLSEAAKLIAEAKKALNYKNAEGLSAAFRTKLDSASKKSATLWWIGGAASFIVATLIIGIWIVTGWGIANTADNNQMIFNLVGRLSMIPFTIAAAVFCANQYTKQKAIIEDYAYKTTIAQSIIAFSEELRDKDPAKYAEYITTILREIHQDPQRKREKSGNDFVINKESAGLIEKLISILPSVISK